MENWQGKPKRQVLREFAQDELLSALELAFLRINEENYPMPDGVTEEQATKEMRKQEARIKKLFGYIVD